MSSLRIYLRNHEAGAQAGRDLFRRASKAQRAQPWAPELQHLTRAVEGDLRSLHQVMRAVSVSPDVLSGLALKLGERAGRLKPNGHLLTRPPLSDLIEVEALLDAVRAKQAGWDALNAADALPAALHPILEDLRRRAYAQITDLKEFHRLAAIKALLVYPLNS